MLERTDGPHFMNTLYWYGFVIEGGDTKSERERESEREKEGKRYRERETRREGEPVTIRFPRKNP